MDAAPVVLPGDTEDHGALGVTKALEQARLLIFGVFFHHGAEGMQDFFRGLQKLRFVGTARPKVAQHPLCVMIQWNQRPFRPKQYFHTRYYSIDLKYTRRIYAFPLIFRQVAKIVI